MNNRDIATIKYSSSSIYNTLSEADKLGLLIEGNETSLAYHRVTNEAIAIINNLSVHSVNNKYKNRQRDSRELTIMDIHRELGLTVHNISSILDTLVKLQIVQSNNGYYSLIPF